MVADAFMEGAKEYENKLRANSDKGSDLEKEMSAAKPDVDTPSKRREQRGGAPSRPAGSTAPSGPSVVKANKPARKLVAAGLADEVEIAQELEQQQEEAPKTDEE